MEGQRFDELARSVADAGSRRSFLQSVMAMAGGALLAVAGLAQPSDLTTEAKNNHRGKRVHSEKRGGGGGKGGGGKGGKGGGGKGGKGKNDKKDECNNNGDCRNPDNPCEKAVCRGGKCKTETQDDGTSCGSGQVCVGGTCVASCGGSNAPCGDGTTCCAGACVDTASNVGNCGACGVACDASAANVCVNGSCRCGGSAPCAAGLTCQQGICGCPGGVCTVNPAQMHDWFFYNDETDQIDNGLGSFVSGPASPLRGTGSAQATVSGQQRRNLSTFRFSGTPLADITTFKYATYNPTVGNLYGPSASGFLVVNIDFNGSDTWQRRIVWVPSVNGAITQNTWKEWDAINNGDGKWLYSGTSWPLPNSKLGTLPKTWNELLTDYPGIRIRVTDAHVGIRVGEPYVPGYTENIDSFTFGTSAGTTVFNFEP